MSELKSIKMSYETIQAWNLSEETIKYLNIIVNDSLPPGSLLTTEHMTLGEVKKYFPDADI